MMSLFDNQDLFGSGWHRFEIGGLSLRHGLQAQPGGRGVQLVSQGQGGRSIAVAGELLGDDSESIKDQWLAIEQCLDGRVATLVDENGSAWEQVVMLGFEPRGIERVGARWRCPYRVMFVQLVP